MDICIKSGSRVTMHFRLKLKNGDTIDETFNSAPATLIIGDNSLPESFEHDLIGCKAGDHKFITKQPAEAFGNYNTKNVHIFPIDKLDIIDDLAIGTVIEFTNANGNTVPAVIKANDNINVTVDFNHPLSGKVIVFEFKVISVSNKAIERDY